LIIETVAIRVLVVVKVVLDSLILIGRARVVPGKPAGGSKSTEIQADLFKTRMELGSTSKEVWTAADI
jgi:hypothetical protein